MKWTPAFTLAVGALAISSAFAPQAQAADNQAQASHDTSAPKFTPPPPDTIPEGDFGDAVRKGQDIFLHTSQFASKYVGNSMNCSSCHMDGGREPNASPMWAAYVLYPAYRSKNGHVNTLAERLQGCFQFSMNGKMPPAESETIVALESYMYWMAKGAPTGVKLEGQGFPKLSDPEQKPDYVRGEKVFTQHCALCHGADGQGQHDATGRMVFPALWGDDSFNWGAGMHGIDKAAAFIRANMPLSRGGSLSEQDAWDVAYFMNAHERPQDPRFDGDLEATIKAHHGGKYDLYGTEIKGTVLGAHSTPAGGRLNPEASKKTH